MPIELNKILRDIAEEKILKPSATNATKEVVELAWLRVAKKSNLSVHETKSIFKVLQKKYEQEKAKEQSTWKLYEVMNEIHTPAEEEEEDEESDVTMEENEEYEMLEVDEEQQQESNQNDGEESENSNKEKPLAVNAIMHSKSNIEMTSDGESPTKSKSDTSHENSPDRASEKHGEIKKISSTLSQPAPREEKKLLNNLLSPNSPRLTKSMTATTAAMALQKKGITLKKANPAPKTQPPQAQQQQQVTGQSILRSTQTSENRRTIQLSESMKRKLNEDTKSTSSTTKKILLGKPSGNVVKQQSPKAVAQKALTQGKISSTGSLLTKKETEPDENSSQSTITYTATSSNTNNATQNTPTITTHHGLKVITFPVDTKVETNSTNNNSGLKVITLPAEGNGTPVPNGLSTPNVKNANGISTDQIEELDFSDHILISSSAAATNTSANSGSNVKNGNIPNTKESTLNLDNFCNDLPRAFFNNLCNSKRHEALCLYAANVMNRLDAPSAARLELKIMRALLDAQSEALKET